jgi:DNA-binding NarL/FixJ family response regulator
MSKGPTDKQQAGSGSATNPIRVMIVEDQTRIRQGLSALIDGTEGFRCTGSFGSMEQALLEIDANPPDLVLVDIGLPGMSGIEGIRRLRESNPDLVMLVLSVYDDDDRIFDALCAGACGYLLKKTPPTRLLESLRECAAGGAPMSPEVARRVIELFRDFRPSERVEYNLTPHELRLLKMLVEGHSYNTAASALGVTCNTISFHMKRVYEKLQVHSKSQAVAKALRDHLLD